MKKLLIASAIAALTSAAFAASNPATTPFDVSSDLTAGTARTYPYSTRGKIVTMPGHSVSSSTKPIMIIR